MAALNFRLSNNNCPISPAWLAPKKKCTFDVTFTPFAVNPVSGTLMIPYGDGLDAEVALSGDGNAGEALRSQDRELPVHRPWHPEQNPENVHDHQQTVTLDSGVIGADFQFVGGDTCGGWPDPRCQSDVQRDGGVRAAEYNSHKGAVKGETLNYGGALDLGGDIAVTLKGAVK